MTIDSALAQAIASSLRTTSTTVGEVAEWLASIETAGDFAVVERDLAQLDGWAIDPATGDLSHATGRFFSIRGVDTQITVDGQSTHWQQPAIDQSDIGVLGLLGTVSDGTLRLLVQAKMEPGNERLVQVSPTVQATASNFERVHQGAATPYLDSFGAPDRPPAGAHFLLRQAQSEQGNRYLGKRNLNAIVVEEEGHIEVDDPRFRWLTLADLLLLSGGRDLLHMDTRSILGSLPLDDRFSAPADTTATLDWWAAMRARVTLERSTLPLAQVNAWSLRQGRLEREAPSPFSVVGVHVTASSREVTSWDQPLVKNTAGPAGTLLVRQREQGWEVLASVVTGFGVASVVELGPSLSTWSRGEVAVDLDESGGLEDLAQAGRIVFDNDLPEEGGRFLHSSVRHRIVDVSDASEGRLPDASRWLSLPEVREIGRTTTLLNMELRSLLSCLPADCRGIG